MRLFSPLKDYPPTLISLPHITISFQKEHPQKKKNKKRETKEYPHFQGVLRFIKIMMRCNTKKNPKNIKISKIYVLKKLLGINIGTYLRSVLNEKSFVYYIGSNCYF